MLKEHNTGDAVHRLRVLSGLNRSAAARRIGVPRSILRSWESHLTTPDAEQLLRAVAALGPDLDQVMVARCELIDHDRLGVLIVGAEQILVADHLQDDTTPQEFNISLLNSYLAAVRRQRGLPIDAQVQLRSQDLSALAVVLDLTDIELQDLLITEFDLSYYSARRAVRGLLTAGLVALASSGALQSSWLAKPGLVSHHPHRTRSSFWAGNLGPTVRGPAFWTGRGLRAELAVWNASGGPGPVGSHEIIELETDHVLEIEPTVGRTPDRAEDFRSPAPRAATSNHR